MSFQERQHEALGPFVEGIALPGMEVHARAKRSSEREQQQDTLMG
jgi:hypothetical protein